MNHFKVKGNQSCPIYGKTSRPSAFSKITELTKAWVHAYYCEDPRKK